MRCAMRLPLVLILAALALPGGARGAQEAPIPSPDAAPSMEEAMRRGEERRLAATEEALKAVASGDPVAALLALDSALELSPADVSLLKAKRSVEGSAAESALKQVKRMRAAGDDRGALTLLGRVRGATDDPRLDEEWKELRVIVGALEDRAASPDERARRIADDAAADAARANGESKDRDRDLAERVRDVERRLDRLSTSPTLEARAEPAVDGLDRRLTETQRDLERQIFELRREVERHQREVDSLRREVDRLRSRP